MDSLEQHRGIIQDDLRGLIAGEVRCDDICLQLYASDASIYEIRPLAVVRPVSAADVVACVQYAAEKHIPIHARGAGSGVAGESLGPGLVLDFSRNLRRVIAIGSETVRVQPGIVHERLNAQLRAVGRMFGPNPAGTAVTTMGSLLAVDASGSRWLKYGSVRRHVRSLQVVLADGQLLELGREPLSDGASLDAHPRKRELVQRVAGLLSAHAEVIRAQQPKGPLNRCGYNVAGVLGEGYLDMAGLLVGSEGTLALFTEALLATQPLARHRGVVLLLFESLERASRAVAEILPWQPSACDLMDRRHLSLARESEVQFDLLIPAETEAALLVEFEGDEPLEIRDRAARLTDEVRNRTRLAFAARHAFERDEMDLFWRLAAKTQPLLYRVKGPRRPVPVVEDAAVPPQVLPDFLVRMQNVLKRHQVTASLLAHAGQGQIHIQPFLDLDDPGDVQRMRLMAEDFYQEVFDAGGTISGEHAYGLSRTSFLRRQAGPLYEVFRQLKQIFDPGGIFNPGKIVSDDEDLLTRNLRPAFVARQPSAGPPAAPGGAEAPPLRNLIELQLNWDPARVVEATAACNRCGECRTQAAGVRMCPIFRFAPAEEASPRAKANIIRGCLTGKVELSWLTSDEFKQVADLCIHCHSCRLECPAGVDIPALMRESKGAYVAANGLRFADWLMTRLDLLAALAGPIAPAANWAIRNRQMRWLMEKTLGIAQGRKLPRITSRNFLRRAARRRLTRPTRRHGRKIVYFVDLYANYHDPQLAEALVAVMEHNGISVYVHPEQKPSGMASIACGALDHARALARHNVAILSEAIRQGYHVVATEPAAALCLTHEYPQLLDDEDARFLAAHASEACSYLWKMHTQGSLQLDFQPITATLGYHTPCMLRALNVGSPGENLLGLIPGLRLRHVEQGCSGMAGTFGLLQKNYRSSLRAGWGLISRLRDPALQAGVTECSACRIQMEQGTTKRTIHPLKLLALAYGLQPGVAALLTTPGEELIIV
ncbi:MAG: anaerobic glycerol-3-phosphate dehydrogenase subunit C [Thermoguttaceae bacterium]|jgi:FAD/FMN-containing dehydrogenase/Fe-S oxidoreductase